MDRLLSFWRELISNASHAIDKVRVLGRTNAKMLRDKSELDIRIALQWEDINSSVAIWTRDTDEIQDEEYQSFWKVVAKEEYIVYQMKSLQRSD